METRNDGQNHLLAMLILAATIFLFAGCLRLWGLRFQWRTKEIGSFKDVMGEDGCYSQIPWTIKKQEMQMGLKLQGNADGTEIAIKKQASVKARENLKLKLPLDQSQGLL